MNRFFSINSRYLIIIIFSFSCATPVSKKIPPVEKIEEKIEEKIVQPKAISVFISPGSVSSFYFPKPQFPPTERPKLLCRSKMTPFIVKGDKIWALIVEPYFSQLRPFTCEFGNVVVAKIQVMEKTYPFEKLNVDKKKVEFTEKDMDRIISEKKKLEVVYQNFRLLPLFDRPFKLPLDSVITDPFGLKRMFNNKQSSHHFGVDFRAPVGTPVNAPATGKVVLAEDLFFTGNTIIINHGLGIFTIYAHFSQLSVRVGEMVSMGTQLGLSGNTGRVTGPHLHWGVKIMGENIDGLALVKETQNL